MRGPESGNVFFYIFIAVALFGALSIAVSQSGRGTVQSATNEQTRLRAAGIIEYSEAIAKAVGTLRLRGTSLANLRFSHPDLVFADYGDPAAADPLNLVFHPSGGGVVYRAPAPDLLATPGEPLAFLTQNEIQDVGTTCAAVGCADLLLAVRGVNTETCLVINKLAGIANPSDVPPDDTEFEFAGKFLGAMGAPVKTIGEEAGSAGLAGKTYGCFKNDGDGKNYFYRVLWAQ